MMETVSNLEHANKTQKQTNYTGKHKNRQNYYISLTLRQRLAVKIVKAFSWVEGVQFEQRITLVQNLLQSSINIFIMQAQVCTGREMKLGSLANIKYLEACLMLKQDKWVCG